MRSWISCSVAFSLRPSSSKVSFFILLFCSLTDSGRAIAEKIYERHNTLSQFFMSIGVDEKTALEDACKVEHYISDVTFEKIKAFAQRDQA